MIVQSALEELVIHPLRREVAADEGLERVDLELAATVDVDGNKIFRSERVDLNAAFHQRNPSTQPRFVWIPLAICSKDKRWGLWFDFQDMHDFLKKVITEGQIVAGPFLAVVQI